MANIDQTPAGAAQHLVHPSDQPLSRGERKQRGDFFSSISDDLLGSILLRVATKAHASGSSGSLSSEDVLLKRIEDALITRLPRENTLFGRAESPDSGSCIQVALSHALVCKRWLRVARFVHPAIVVPTGRFFSSRALASLLTSRTSGFPNLRHLHLGEFAVTSVDSHLVESICTASGSSLTHLTIHLYDRRSFLSTNGCSIGHGKSTSLSPSNVAAIFESCTRLVNLRVSFAEGTQEVPAAISCLQQLTRLKMRLGKRVTELPAEFGRLLLLKDLEIESGSFDTLSDPICCLPSLERLSLSCDISRLTGDFGKLRNLKIVRFSFVQDLVELPDSFCELASLTLLSVEHCDQFARLPENFHLLPNQETLQLSHLAEFTELPESIGHLPALKDLHIQSCEGFMDLPGSISANETLRRLTISSCFDFASLPDDIGQILTLQSLTFESLEVFSGLPDSLSQLTALEQLKIVDCLEFERLPASVSAMAALTSLILDGCEVQVLPEDFGQLPNLVSLKLSSSAFSVFPQSFGQLEKLKILELYTCYELSELPASFSSLSSLETLIIYGGSSLETLPQGFEQLPQLRTLELYNCAIEILPEKFGQLENLTILKVGTARKYTRRDSDFGPFLQSDFRIRGSEPHAELEGFSDLGSLPQSLVLLPRLEELVIDGCHKLKELPIGMGKLSSLKVLDLKNCENLRVFPSLLASPSRTPETADTVTPDTSTATSATVPAAPAATSSELRTIPGPSGCSAPFPSLQRINIFRCRQLQFLPEGLDLIPNLESLTLSSCAKLMPADQSACAIPPGTSTHLPPAAPTISLPRSLKSLSIWDSFQAARCLPESFLSLTRLVSLNLYGLKSLTQLIAPPSMSHTPATAQFEGWGEEASPQSPSFDEPFRLDVLKSSPGSADHARLELLCSLEWLQIGDTKLPSLPENLTDLRSLKVLEIEDCPAMASLPASLTGLSRLEQLDVTFLPLLTHLPEDLAGLSALTVLEVLACAGLQGLPSSLSLPSSLIKLSISECPQITCLPDSLSSLTRLSSLELTRLPGLQHIPSSLSLPPSLIHVSLLYCDRLEALPDSLGSLSCLREVDLDGCEQLKELPQSLLDSENLIEIKGTWGVAAIECREERWD